MCDYNTIKNDSDSNLFYSAENQWIEDPSLLCEDVSFDTLIKLPLVKIKEEDLDALYDRFDVRDEEQKLVDEVYLRQKLEPCAINTCKRVYKKWDKYSETEQKGYIKQELDELMVYANAIEKPVVDRTFPFEEFCYYPTREDYYKANLTDLSKVKGMLEDYFKSRKVLSKKVDHPDYEQYY